jgi:hypothetical protein
MMERAGGVAREVQRDGRRRTRGSGKLHPGSLGSGTSPMTVAEVLQAEFSDVNVKPPSFADDTNYMGCTATHTAAYMLSATPSNSLCPATPAISACTHSLRSAPAACAAPPATQ